jgi:hypothetical protein
MDRNTIVRIALPIALYEAVKSKVLNEALNKDIRAFGQDLDNKLKAAGIKTDVLFGKRATSEEIAKVKNSTGSAIAELSQTPETQMMILYFSPKDKSKVMKAVDYFQLIPYDGQVLKKGWSAKQVKGAINPGDIYKQESGEGQIQFIRLAKTDPKVKTISETEEPKKKKPSENLNDPEYLKKIKAATEKAMNGDTTDLALLMFPGMQEAKEGEPIEEISAQTKYNAVKKATQDAESERGKSDDLFRAKRRQQAMTAAVHINPAIESEARKIADMLTQSTGAAGFRASIDKLRDDNGSYVELEFINRGNIDDNIIFKIKKDGVKVINQDRIPKELERKLTVFVDKIRKAELDINTDDSTGSMNEAKKPSAGMSEKEKSAVAKKAKAGKDIGKKGKGFEKVAAKAAKEYGSKEKGEKVAAAQMWKAQAKK